MRRSLIMLSILGATPSLAAEPNNKLETCSTEEIIRGLKDFYLKTARPDGSFQPRIDPNYRGMSDAAYSDLAAVTYAVTIHKTFGWKLPFEEKTVELLLSRSRSPPTAISSLPASVMVL
jgi:hypothetical protein